MMMSTIDHSTHFAAAATLGGTGLFAWAYGAHVLRRREQRCSPTKRDAFLTASHYQLIHSAALFSLAILRTRTEDSALSSQLRTAFWLLGTGVSLFSASIYSMVLQGPKALGPGAHVGGCIALLFGWVSLMLTTSPSLE